MVRNSQKSRMRVIRDFYFVFLHSSVVYISRVSPKLRLFILSFCRSVKESIKESASGRRRDERQLIHAAVALRQAESIVKWDYCALRMPKNFQKSVQIFVSSEDLNA